MPAVVVEYPQPEPKGDICAKDQPTHEGTDNPVALNPQSEVSLWIMFMTVLVCVRSNRNQVACCDVVGFVK